MEHRTRRTKATRHSGSDFPDPLPAVIVLSHFLSFLLQLVVCSCLAVILVSGCCAIAAIMLAGGMVSTSLLVGVLR